MPNMPRCQTNVWSIRYLLTSILAYIAFTFAVFLTFPWSRREDLSELHRIALPRFAKDFRERGRERGGIVLCKTQRCIDCMWKKMNWNSRYSTISPVNTYAQLSRVKTACSRENPYCFSLYRTQFPNLSSKRWEMPRRCVTIYPIQLCKACVYIYTHVRLRTHTFP